MAVPGIHNRMIERAARAQLAPLGLFQKGRSRTWYDDHGFWAIVVEFQPSGFGRGSYLNVGACWLWCAQDHWSFDFFLNERVSGFEEFESEAQFEVVAGELASRAADEVRALRARLSSLRAIAGALDCKLVDSGWPTYHAAVACGLVGDRKRARRHFDALAAERDELEWFHELQARAARLAAELDDVARFRAAVADEVRRARSLLKLPELATIAFD